MTPAPGLASVVVNVSAMTDPGLKRTNNEDSFLAASPVFVVADGMGGYDAGDRASAAVVDAFRLHVHGPAFPTLEDVREALVAANDGVSVVADATKRGAGSTVRRPTADQTRGGGWNATSASTALPAHTSPCSSTC